MSEETKIEKIKAQDLSYAAEIRSLSLFLRFKLEVIEGRKEALGKSVVCALNVKKPGLAAPHRVENDTFLFRRSNVIYQYTCKKVIVELVESDSCFQGAPIKQVGKYKFIILREQDAPTRLPKGALYPKFPSRPARDRHLDKIWSKSERSGSS